MRNIKYQQIETINNSNKIEYISTGATIGNIQFIALPTILGIYNISDPTLRKYLKENGVENQEYFFSDGKLFISKLFINRNGIQPKSFNTSTFHPYRKKRIEGSKIPYNILKETERTTKDRLIKEYEKISWNFYITISIYKFMSQDDWDVIMLKFIDHMSKLLGSNEIKALYATELYNVFEPKTKYDKEHRHIHILFFNNHKKYSAYLIRKTFQDLLRIKKFVGKEYKIESYNPSEDGVKYIFKQYSDRNKNCSEVYPQKE